MIGVPHDVNRMPVSFSIQMAGETVFVVPFCPVGPAIQVAVDTVAFVVQVVFYPVAFAVQAMVYSISDIGANCVRNQ